MPLIGQESFLRQNEENDTEKTRSVSMPLIGQESFLRKRTKRRFLRKSCVNALDRAGVISTKSMQILFSP